MRNYLREHLGEPFACSQYDFDGRVRFPIDRKTKIVRESALKRVTSSRE